MTSLPSVRVLVQRFFQDDPDADVSDYGSGDVAAQRYLLFVLGPLVPDPAPSQAHADGQNGDLVLGPHAAPPCRPAT